MTAPTEQEIREILADRERRYPHDFGDKLAEAIDHAFDAIGYVELDEQGQYDFGGEWLSDTWADLRQSEQRYLAGAILQAKGRALASAREAIVGEVVAAALQFAREYPDAPRA